MAINRIQRLQDMMSQQIGPLARTWSSALNLRCCLCWLLVLALIGNAAAPLRAQQRGSSIRNPQSAIRHPLSLHPLQASPVEAVTVRRGPDIAGRVEGTVRQLAADSTSLTSDGEITGDLLVPGTPQIDLTNQGSIGSIVEGTGSAQPTNYTIRVGGTARINRLVTRTDPIILPGVNPPPAPTGTRDVELRQPGQSPGDFATLRDLTLLVNAGAVAVPPGTYRNFEASGVGNKFIFGVAGSSQPAVYNLQSLTLNNTTAVELVGPVILNLGLRLDLNGNAMMGAAASPAQLALNVAQGNVLGNVNLTNNSRLYAVLRAPASRVSLGGDSQVQGQVFCEALEMTGDSLLKGVISAQATLDSVAPAGANQGQTLTVTLRGLNTHWAAGQTRASFGGEVSVGGAAYGDLGLVQVTDATAATAQVTVSPTAALAPRTVRVVTPISGSPDEEVSLVDIFTVTAATPPGAAAATVSTIAGAAGTPGFADGTGVLARFRDLAGIAAGPNDAVYVADAGNHRIRRVATDGTVTTVAGDGTPGFADGPAASARFSNPQGVAVEVNGVVYVADTGNHRIRRIATDGTVTTFAGDGTPGLQDGLGSGARFNALRGVAIDSQGNLYVADTGNAAVRKVSPVGQVQTVAGDGTVGSNDSPNARFDGLAGVAWDGERIYVYLADTGNHRIRRLDSSNTVMTIAGAERGFADGTASQARFAEPSGIAVDGAGHLIIADTINSLVRSVNPELAANGAPGAVTTLAGTGDRGLTDGAGDVVRFFTPRGVAVLSSSAIVVADTGNQVLRRILLPPVITSFDPTQARPGETVTITGERFDGRAPERNTVKFTRAAYAGGGQTTAQVTSATRTQLTVIVPVDAETGPLSVQTEGGTATSATNFEFIPPVPVISDFNPQVGFVGDTVTLTGTALKIGNETPAVTFAGQNSTRLSALVTFSSPSEVRATVPNGAITGVIELTTAGGRATTSSNFIVDTRQDYQLTAAPSAATAVQGSTATYVIYLTSPQTTFTQLAQLSVTDAPAGVTADFDPPQITAGARATLSLSVAGTLSPGSYALTVRGSALADGRELIRTTAITLNVMAAGQTTLAGRVLSSEDEPILGATVSLDGRTATTDAAGSFLLAGVTASVNRPLMVDGRTASAPNRTYPVIIEPATIVAGQANVVPYTFYLPPIDTQYEVEVIPNQNTIVTTPRVNGLSMTIPAGANLRNRDGSPVARVSLTPVPIDRTPAPLPAQVTIPILFCRPAIPGRVAARKAHASLTSAAILFRAPTGSGRRCRWSTSRSSTKSPRSPVNYHRQRRWLEMIAPGRCVPTV